MYSMVMSAFCLKIEYLTSLNNDLKSSYQPTTPSQSNTSRLIDLIIIMYCFMMPSKTMDNKNACI